MPGPPRWRTPLLVTHTLTAQKVLTSTLNERVTSLLTFVQFQGRRNPDIVYGDGKEGTRDSPEAREFCRKVAAEGIVLLKNEGGALPLNQGKVRTIAVIGPNAKGRVISGSGSAALTPSYVVTPFEGIVDGAPQGVEVKYSVGCYAHKYLPTLETSLTTPDGQSPGWLCTFFNQDKDGNTANKVAECVLNDTRVRLNGFLPDGLTPTWTIKLKGILKFDKTAPYELGLTVAGRAKLWVDGKLTIDNWTKQTPGEFFYGQGTVEEEAVVNFTAGEGKEVLVEYINTFAPSSDQDQDDKPNGQPAPMRGVRLGGTEKVDPDKAIDEVASLAAASDVVMYVGGLSPEWESEGFDRPTLQLPGKRQDELISRLGKANMNTVVCIQAGSAVAMPWINEVNGLLHTWYSGNEAGRALADVLYGTVNSSGRMSISFPARFEDIPAHPNLYCENSKIHYREDLFVGYKFYPGKEIKPLFPFGYGLSYTNFAFTAMDVNLVKMQGPEVQIDVTVSTKNTGSLVGSEVAQLYISFPDVGVTTPRHQLKAFAKIKDLPPGQTKEVHLRLDKYAVSFWDVLRSCWTVGAGTYRVSVGPSSDALPLEGGFELKDPFYWSGL